MGRFSSAQLAPSAKPAETVVTKAPAKAAPSS